MYDEKTSQTIPQRMPLKWTSFIIIFFLISFIYIILLFISFIYYKIKAKYNIIGGIEKFRGASHERGPF
jgi:hypothetical protein